jgi:large subunit ribosomal protein L9
MRVILSCDVAGLGKTGDIVSVRDGFARNYLFPKKLALEATAGNLRVVEEQKKARELRQQKELNLAKELATKISNLSLTISVESKDDDTLYGNITELNISKAFEAEGLKIDKKKIRLEIPIDRLGIYQIPVQLHPQVLAKVKLWVVKK